VATPEIPANIDELRERLLARASLAATWNEPHRRQTMKGLVRENLTLRAGDLFRHPSYPIDQYWSCWLAEPLSLYEFADLLALDLIAEKYPGPDDAAAVIAQMAEDPVRAAAKAGDFFVPQICNDIYDRVRIGVEAGELEMTCRDEFLATMTWRRPKFRIDPRQVVDWMLDNPNARDLVPATLSNLLTPRIESEGRSYPVIDMIEPAEPQQPSTQEVSAPQEPLLKDDSEKRFNEMVVTFLAENRRLPLRKETDKWTKKLNVDRKRVRKIRAAHPDPRLHEPGPRGK
jgi:hypothetical protein